MLSTDPCVTGTILAGGQANRMHGQDKGLLPLDGRPLIEYVIAALTPQVDRILISANRNIDRYRAYGHPVVSDRNPGYTGPLAGMLAALQASESGLLLCVPCDGPWLPQDLFVRLYASMRQNTAEISCVYDGKRLHPVYALLQKSLQQPLADYIDDGGRAVHRWFNSRRLALVDFSDCPELFVNINTSEELHQAEVRLRERSKD